MVRENLGIHNTPRIVTVEGRENVPNTRENIDICTMSPSLRKTGPPFMQLLINNYTPILRVASYWLLFPLAFEVTIIIHS